MNRELITPLLLIFMITQAVGLYAGNYLVEQGIHTTIVNDNPESIDNSIGLIVWILITTAVLLALIVFAPQWVVALLLKVLECAAIFSTAIIVIAPTNAPEIIGFGIAILLVILRIVLARNVLLRNVTSTVATAGAGALIGASLGTIPLLAFLLLLAIYDYIAVFKTKHMLTLANGIKEQNLSFTFALPTKEHQFELGTGDIVVPLAFAVSVLAASKLIVAMPYALIAPLAILAASLIGIFATLNYASKTKQPLPALPVQAIFMAIMFVVLKLAGLQ